MKRTIVLPKLKENAQDAMLCAWLKAPGERVEKGEAICEIEMDKVVCQIEAAFSGVLGTQFAEEGDTIQVGDAVATVEEDA
ncbi:MAG: lipoyl domain-containing protein [Oscillospiraceae bacterium]|nr:lipoyl domain-containing protein [Oscillospiraceae bacterium]